MAKYMADVTARIGTHLFSIDARGIKTLKRYLTDLRNFYIDISDQGNARLSEKAAIEFTTYVRNAFLTGKYQSRVPALDKAYAAKKQRMFPSRPIGIRTGETIGGLTHFRSRVGGDPTKKGYVVGLDPSHHRRHHPLQLRLEGLTYGRPSKDQPARPIFHYAFEDFVRERFSAIISETLISAKTIIKRR